MDIQKEKDAFLNVFQLFKSFKGIGFSEETEQFFLKKNKPNDAECLDVSNLNQMWRAWWARAKSQAVPEGFVLVPQASLKVALSWMDADIDPWQMSSDCFSELYEHKPILEKAMEAQEQSHD